MGYYGMPDEVFNKYCNFLVTRGLVGQTFVVDMMGYNDFNKFMEEHGSTKDMEIHYYNKIKMVM